MQHGCGRPIQGESIEAGIVVYVNQAMQATGLGTTTGLVGVLTCLRREREVQLYGVAKGRACLWSAGLRQPVINLDSLTDAPSTKACDAVV
jgi:hypothetical protein